MRRRPDRRLVCLLAALLVVAGLRPFRAEADPALVPQGTPAGAATAAPEPDPLFDEGYDEQLETAGEFADADPFERVNRKIFGFNLRVDHFVLDPITRGYQFVVPEPARRAIFRAFQNLESPVILANDLLQLRFRNAAETTGRFVLNTTVGMAGLFDAGKAAGWERHEADFGQTLALAGVGSGPYLVLPVLGPSTVRDGIGSIIDRLFQPLTYVLGPTQFIALATITGGSGLAYRDEYSQELNALEDSSVDFYAALRSAYLQSRKAQIWGPEPLDGEDESAVETGALDASAPAVAPVDEAGFPAAHASSAPAVEPGIHSADRGLARTDQPAR